MRAEDKEARLTFFSVKRFVCQPGVTSDDLITLEESLCTLACGVIGRESSIYRGPTGLVDSKSCGCQY